MMWPQLEAVAQIAIGRILNSLPEGLLIALFAWMMLRFLPRQNSGTRFAVWFVALLAVAGLPLIGAGTGGNSLLTARVARPLITLPGPWGLLLFLAWVLAACVAMLRLATGLWHLGELRKSCVMIDVANLDPAVGKTIAEFSSSRTVALATSEGVSVPAAIGFFRPMIVIPAWALRELLPEELNVILLHEFAHLRRWDDWTNLLQKIVRAVFLFHPAVWWIESRLSLEREMACDDLVLAETANPRGYAKCLIALLEKRFARRGWAMAQAIVHRAREASLRLAHVLDVSRPDTRHVWKPALGLVGAFSLVCVMVVPRGPQFVAFERNTPVIHTDAVHSTALSQSQLPSAPVIPAAMRTRQLSSLKKMPQRPATQVAERRSPALRAGATRWSAETERNPVFIVRVGANQSAVAEPETLLLIQTTQRVGPNSWVWSVCVWRVTWVNPAQDGAKRVPVASRT
jgi:beta-lactamase regulating signal transducer with metallopeptidase domain